MDLSRRRDLMGTKGEPEELYPVGTDVIGLYIGRDASGYGLFIGGKILDNNGEYVDGSGASSPVYMPISPRYRYQKTRSREGINAGRIVNMSYYDANYNYIGRIARNNLNVEDLPAPPTNARYIRVQTMTLVNNWGVAIVRIS